MVPAKTAGGLDKLEFVSTANFHLAGDMFLPRFAFHGSACSCYAQHMCAVLAAYVLGASFRAVVCKRLVVK